MNSNEFVAWLEGFLAGVGELTPEHAEQIKKKLAEVQQLTYAPNIPNQPYVYPYYYQPVVPNTPCPSIGDTWPYYPQITCKSAADVFNN